jgi:lambda repressor-like predicted transcriptional regulator
MGNETMATISPSSTKKERVASLWQASALQAASPIVLALEECEDELREEAVTLFQQLASGELTPDEEFSTVTLLAEILFPNEDGEDSLGLDLESAEKTAKQLLPQADSILDKMDRQEEPFANLLRALMEEKGMTQAELAEKLGIGQPAISMMLQRQCRPQKRTVIRIAEALGVEPSVLWPGL